jgi:hypothetical protein
MLIYLSEVAAAEHADESEVVERHSRKLRVPARLVGAVPVLEASGHRSSYHLRRMVLQVDSLD